MTGPMNVAPLRTNDISESACCNCSRVTNCGIRPCCAGIENAETPPEIAPSTVIDATVAQPESSEKHMVSWTAAITR